MFSVGTRVRFYTASGPRLGIVAEVLSESIDGDHVHRVQPDDGLPVMLLLGRSLHPAEADAPFIVENRPCSKAR